MRSLVALLLALGACAAPTEPSATPDDCGCMRATTDAESLQTTGFVVDAIYASSGYSAADADGKTRFFAQVDPTLTTPAQIAAAPAVMCASQGFALVSSEVGPPGPDDQAVPGSLIVKAVCA
jgi:hypothetical protein